jgi:hypothetical protein
MLLEERELVGLAAFAGTKAGRLGCFGAIAKPHVLALGPLGGAGGPAIDAGGLDASIEDPIVGGIAGEEGVPARVLVKGADGGRSRGGYRVAHDLVLK